MRSNGLVVMEQTSICPCQFLENAKRVECFKKPYITWLQIRNIEIPIKEINNCISISELLKLLIKPDQLTTTEQICETKIILSFLNLYQKTHPYLGNCIHELPFSNRIQEFKLL